MRGFLVVSCTKWAWAACRPPAVQDQDNATTPKMVSFEMKDLVQNPDGGGPSFVLRKKARRLAWVLDRCLRSRVADLDVRIGC